MRTARLASILLLGTGLLAHCVWILEFFIPTGVSPVQDPVDALLTANPVFRIAFAISGLAFMLAGPPLVRLSPVQWAGRISAGAICTFGAGTLIAAAFPESSAPVSAVANFVFIAGAVTLILWWPPGWRAFAAIAVGIVTLVWLATVISCQLGPGHYAGIFTRALLVIRVLMLSVGLAFIVLTPVPRHAPRAV